MKNPLSLYPDLRIPEQRQDEPGLDSELQPKADHGDKSYVGAGRLKGRKALITGGDSGIGRAVAVAYAREGADIAFTYLPVEKTDADEVVKILSDTGVKVCAIEADFIDNSFAKDVVTKTIEAIGGLDILVNNAGKQVHVEDIAELDIDQVSQTFQVNIVAQFALVKAALPHLPEGATIINTTSIQAYEPSPGLLDYAATKAAIANFTKGLALQLASKGIRVNGVAPGPIWTPLQPSYGQPMDKLTSFGSGGSMGRAGQPAELAPSYVFLASGESSYTTGEIIAVTGGQFIS